MKTQRVKKLKLSEYKKIITQKNICNAVMASV